MQSSVSQYGPVAFAGLLDGVNVPRMVRSYAAEAAIGLARPVMLGTNKDEQVLPATTGAAAIGFAIHDQAREQNSAGLVQYAVKEAVSVLTAGRFWAPTSDAVVAGALANVTVATGALTDAAVAAGIEAFTQVQVTFITSTTGPGLALVEVK
jgi:hypothetical protein